MIANPGYTRRASNIDREVQPVAIVSVDPDTRIAVGMTRTRNTIQINCAYATGDTITVPAVGEQWYAERIDMEWRLYGRIPFNDATLKIPPEEGQVSVGSAVGPLELNGSEVRANGLFRLNKYYYRDNGITLQRSSDGVHWTSISADTESIAAIATSAANVAADKITEAIKDPLNNLNSDLEGFINGLDSLITININSNSKIQEFYTRITSAQDRADEAFANALDAKLANAAADALVDWKARAGSNLVLDGKFNDSTLKRFPLNDTQESGYFLNEVATPQRPNPRKAHSGIQSWIWTQFPGIECGFKMAPTERINHFDVTPGEIYFVESWIYPNIENTVTHGSIKIGGTLSDTSQAEGEDGELLHPDIDIITDSVSGNLCEYAQNGPDVVPGRWNKINISVEIPAGYDRIVFWIKTTADTIGGNQYWIDDVTVREATSGTKAKIQADLANFVVKLKAVAGANLVLDPKFTSRLTKRYPLNDDELYEYVNKNTALGYPKPHSGILMWKWVQETNAACGLVLAPTHDVESIQVNAGGKYFVEAHVHPKTTNSGNGEIRIGATFTDLNGDLEPRPVYESFDFATKVVPGAWSTVSATIEVPGGFEIAKFWVAASEGAAAGDVFFVDDVTIRESTDSVKAQIQADFAESLVDAKSRAGANLVIDPKFTSRAITRYPYYAQGQGNYTLAEHHSGLQSWSWVHYSGHDCGIILNPTAKINTYQVSYDENYMVSAWVKPSNSSSGVLRVGATFIDTSGTLEDSADNYVEYPLATAVPAGGWTQVSAPIVIPEGFDTAQFWVVSHNAVEGSTFYIDDASIKDNTAADASSAEAKLANFVVDLKAKAGSNLVIDPKFSNILVARFPYNSNQVSSYTAEQRKDGLTSWKWKQSANIPCGLVLAPTVKVDTFQVDPEEKYYLEAYLFPKSDNSVANPTVWIGATFYDNSGDLSPSILHISPTIVRGVWNQISTTVTVPGGYQEAKFWVVAPATTPANEYFYIDTVQVKEVTGSESIVSGIGSSVTGTGTTGNTTATTVSGHLKSAWAKFVDGLRQRSLGTTQSALPDDVHAAATETSHAADVAVAAAGAAASSVQRVEKIAGTAAKDYSNIAAGSNFETWTQDSDPTDAIDDSQCIQPWILTGSRWSVNGAHIMGGPGGYMEAPSTSENYVDSPYGHSLVATPGTLPTYAVLSSQPEVQSGEQFYIEFMALRDSFYNGTNELSRLRVGYNSDDIFLDKIAFGATMFSGSNVWTKFSKTITVPVGAEYLTFSLSANHNTTNTADYQAVPSTARWNGNMPPGQMGRIYIDNVVIKRLVPPDGVEPLPQDKVQNLAANMAALAAYQGASIIPNGDFENSSYRTIHYYSGTWGVGNYDDTLGPGVNAAYVAESPHSGTQCIKLTAGGLGWARVVVPLDPLGKGPVFIPCAADGTDVFKVECWVKGHANNTYTSYQGIAISFWPKELNVQNTSTPFSSTIGAENLTTPSQAQPRGGVDGEWTKISDVFSPPSGITGFYLTVEGSGNNNIWWVDDFACFRVTEGATLATHVATALTADPETIASSPQRSLDNALDALTTTYKQLSDHTRQINELQTAKAAATVKGVSSTTNFSEMDDQVDSLPGFTVSYPTGSGTSKIGISKGIATWVNTSNADKDSRIVSTTPTLTDYQVLRGVMSTAPQSATGGGGTPKFHAIGRVSASGTSYVWARAYSTGSWLQFRGEIGCTVNGTETTWASNIPLTWSLDMRFVVGVGTNSRQYQVYSGNTLVWTHTEGGTGSGTNYSSSGVTSLLGSDYRKWGAIAQIRAGSTGPRSSGGLSGCTAIDNPPLTVNGSTARMVRTSDGVAAFNSGENGVPSGFFTVAHESLDINAEPSDGTFTVTDAKTYTITGRIRLSVGNFALCHLVLQKYVGSQWVTVQYGDSVNGPAAGAGLSGKWIQYLNAGDKVRLATIRESGSSNTLTGESDGVETYFSITA